MERAWQDQIFSHQEEGFFPGIVEVESMAEVGNLLERESLFFSLSLKDRESELHSVVLKFQPTLAKVGGLDKNLLWARCGR